MFAEAGRAFSLHFAREEDKCAEGREAEEVEEAEEDEGERTRHTLL